MIIIKNIILLITLWTSCFVNEVVSYTYTVDHNGAIKGEYVFFVKKEYVRNGIPDFIVRMSEKYGVEVKPHMHVCFGKYYAYLVRGLTEEYVDYVRNRYGLKVVEANRVVKASGITYREYVKDPIPPSNMSDTATFCYEQNTGSNLWGLSRINQRAEFGQGRGRYRWSYNDDGTDVNVYVVDSGCNVAHEEFGGRAVKGYTAKEILENEGDEDLNGHGTHVSGTIAGTTFGVAKAANIIAVKALDKQGLGTIANIVEGLGYIYNDVKDRGISRAIINLSLGAYGTSFSLERTITMCIEAGIHVVVASGNDFDDSCLYTPAHVAEAITVGSSNIRDEASLFGNYGACVDVFAPGEAIVSAFIPGKETYAIADGTSMAAPHVAGAIARYISHFKNDAVPSPSEVAAYIDRFSTKNALDFTVFDSLLGALETKNKILYTQCSQATTVYSAASHLSLFKVLFYVTFCCITLNVF